MKNLKSNLPLISITIIGLMALFFMNTQPAVQEISYSKFRQLAFNQPERLDKVILDGGERIVLVMSDGTRKSTPLPRSVSGNRELLDKLAEKGIETEVNSSDRDGILLWLVQLLPLLIFLPLLFFMMRSFQGGSGQAFNFVRSKAKKFNEENVSITFDDVAGIDEAKQELQEIVTFLQRGEKFRALGAKIPKGVLLIGPPGTGKTLLAKAIAGEAGVPFYSISGSDFVEMFVGVGASRVRDLFEQARKQSPCIVFVDELDAIGRQRGTGMGGHDEREQTLNQLLVEMDGFENTNVNVIILAATNRPEILDGALTRPGRFDRRITINYPDAKGRELILKVHSKGKKISQEVELRTIAKRTPGFTGAELANVMNEAALLAATKDKNQIENDDLDEAIDKVYMGSKRNVSVPFKELEMTAYHETGHALIAMKDDVMPLHKVTIVPRGMAMGVTWSLNEDDYIHWTRRSLLSRIRVSLGGMAAEQLVYNDTTAGVVVDLDNCTQIARRMVTQFGMSELGPISLGKESYSIFGELSSRDYSEDTAKQVDSQVKHIIDQCYEDVRKILSDERAVMDAVVYELLTRETLDSKEVKNIYEQVQNDEYDFEAAKARVEELRGKIEEKQHQWETSPTKGNADEEVG